MDRDTIEAVEQCYQSWKTRHNVTKPGHRCHKDYHDRGICVDAVWSNPLTFIKWSLFEAKERFALGLSIDRIDNDKGYYPWNCRWATSATQNRNRTITKLSMVKAREIRAIANYFTQREIADIYDTHQTVIGKVIRNETWKELEPVPRPIWVVSDEEILNITRLWDDWKNMKHRVTPGYVYHHRYHDIGVIVCEEWYDFPTYYNWAVANGSRQGLTIDRKDNDGNYEYGNCWFATPAEQIQNRSITVLNPTLVWQIRDVCAQKDLTLKVIAQIYGVSVGTICGISRRNTWKNI